MYPQAEKVARGLRGLAHPLRYCIALNLVPGEKSVSDITKKIGGVAQPVVSHHLLIMRNSGILTARKVANKVYYSIAGKKMAEHVQKLHETFIM